MPYGLAMTLPKRPKVLADSLVKGNGMCYKNKWEKMREGNTIK